MTPDGEPDSGPDLAADNARLRRLLEARDAPAELRHRLNNALRLLRDVIRTSAETRTEAATFAAHLDGRVSTLGRIFNTIDFAGALDLHIALAEEFRVHAVHEGPALQLAGPTILFQPRAAQAMGLVIHELVINAIEHGAMAGPSGRVAISWTLEPRDNDPLLSLTWKEFGPTSLAEPTRRGFGTKVITEMARHELDAVTRLAYEPDGVSYTMRFPLPPRIGRAAAA